VVNELLMAAAAYASGAETEELIRVFIASEVSG
jgi:hypothetical protein